MSALLSPADLRRLDRLGVRRRRSVRGGAPGEWQSRRYGAYGLFADHRPYSPGDDLRYVDWNVYGRLGELFVKRFEAEENVDLVLFLDRSLSMSGPKALAARRIAGALGYLALTHLDHVRLAWLPAPDAGPSVGDYRARSRAQAFLRDLEQTGEGGRTDHVRDLGRVVGAIRRRGLAVFVSDLFDPVGAIRGLSLLRGMGLSLSTLHVVDPADAALPDGHSFVAVDRETGESVALDVTDELRRGVYEAWERRATAVMRWCRAHEVAYLRVDARQSLWSALRDALRARVAIEA